jgi:hypothetical protein
MFKVSAILPRLRDVRVVLSGINQELLHRSTHRGAKL